MVCSRCGGPHSTQDCPLTTYHHSNTEKIEIEVETSKQLEIKQAKLQAFANALSEEWGIPPPKVQLFKREDMAKFQRIFPELGERTAAFYNTPDRTIYYGGTLNRTKIIHELLHHKDLVTSELDKRINRLFKSLRESYPEKSTEEIKQLAEGISRDSIEYEIEDKTPKLVRQYAELWHRLVEAND